jgi:voltage-gated potassium channel
MWWALQTVTTVGYGDVTPQNVSGRTVAAIVMLYGIAFLTITIAAITSTFVARAEREQNLVVMQAGEQGQERLKASLDDLATRLDRLEQLLGELAAGPRGPG